MSRKIALITGAFQGIGRATAELMMERDFHVVMADVQDCTGAAAVYSEQGMSASALLLDLSDSTTFADVATQLEQAHGHLDVLINNAAILVDMGLHPSCVPETTLRKVIEINHIGPFLLTAALVPLLKAAPAARVVNVSSQVAQLAQLCDMESPLRDDVCAAYQTSKIGVNAMTVLYAKELEQHGIKVNSCCPGWVDSGMNLEELPDYGEEARPKTPREGADTAVWLATLGADGPTAGFFTDRQPIPW